MKSSQKCVRYITTFFSPLMQNFSNLIYVLLIPASVVHHRYDIIYLSYLHKFWHPVLPLDMNLLPVMCQLIPKNPTHPETFLTKPEPKPKKNHVFSILCFSIISFTHYPFHPYYKYYTYYKFLLCISSHTFYHPMKTMVNN